MDSTTGGPATLDNHVALSSTVSVRLMRTLRLPDDGHDHPLPPGLGSFPIYETSALDGWRGTGDAVVPVHAREALWLSFEAPYHQPHALKVGVGGADAISGESFDATRLSATPQDYVVIPEQPWLDGINSGKGTVRQFVAVPLGAGLTVEAQLTAEERGGLELVLFQPKPGRFPDEPHFDPGPELVMCCAPESALGLGAGGSLQQEIYEDEHGFDTWESVPAAHVRVELVDAIDFAALTGRPVPPTPISAATYAEHGLPWFELYDPVRRDIAPVSALRGVQSVAALEGRDVPGVRVGAGQVITYVGRPTPR